jgi:hypothetical protein
MAERADGHRLSAARRGLLTTRQAIVVVIIILAIATIFAAVSVEVFGGDE